MPYTIEYNKDEPIIEMKITGKLDHALLKEITAGLVKIAKENNCYRLLSNYRETSIELSTIEIFDMPQFLSGLTSSLGLELFKFKRTLVTTER